MADRIISTARKDFQTESFVHPSNVPSIWDRLPYNIGMELHQLTSVAASTAICQQKIPPTPPLSTSSYSASGKPPPPPPPFVESIDDDNFNYNSSLAGVIKTARTSSSARIDTLTLSSNTDSSSSATGNANSRVAVDALDNVKNYENDDETTNKNKNRISLKDDLVITNNNNKLIKLNSTKRDVNIMNESTTQISSSSSSSSSSSRLKSSWWWCATQTEMQAKCSRKLNDKFKLNSDWKMLKHHRSEDKTFRTIFYLIVYILTTASTGCLAARQDVPSNCTFPQRWEGSWFLSGYQQSIHIKGSQFSYRGKCAASDGNKYLIVDDRGCHRCLVIYEKHKNVLQYKESECEGDSMYMDQSNPAAMPMRSILKSDHRGGAHPNTNGHSRLSSSDRYIMRSNDDMNDCPSGYCRGRETLQTLCDQIPGDALLYSLFRENAEAVKCPLKGPFAFTYNRGHGECKSPVSNIESCTEDSRLLLSFQACPDVQGTESTVEELTCLATWKDGNSRYLVGLVLHHHAISNEERYRCFVYEKISSLMGGLSSSNLKDAEYKLAQSGDATCNGLDSAEVGSRIMTLRKPPPAERCDFPVWFKGPRHWHALMGNAVYNYHPNDGSMHIIKPNGLMETRALCEQINKQTSEEMMAVVHYTTGCKSGFMCMMFYRRDTHVIEIQSGKQASRLEDACAPDHFDINKMPYITLLANNPEAQECPLDGLYHLRGAIGPPYIQSRHKRNHNNKAHNQHSHHHHETGHKRHGTFSFRNSEEFGQTTSWHSHTRGLPIRSRRDANAHQPLELPPTSYELARNTAGMSANSHLSKSVSIQQLKSNESDSAKITIATTSMDNKQQQPEEQNQQQQLEQSTNGVISGNRRVVVGRDLRLNETQRNRRDAPGCIVNYKAQRQLWIGCTERNVIDVRPLCNEDGDEEYLCHGHWMENGTTYVIARHKGTKHGVCISYRKMEGNAAKLVIGDACYRGLLKPPDHHLVANLTVIGKCGDTSSSRSIHFNSSIGALMLAASSIILTISMFTNR